MNSATRKEVEAPRALAVPIACLAASLLLRAAFWFQRAYNHDDFYFAYVGWLRSTPLRPSVDYYVPSFMPLAELWAPLFRSLPLPFAALDAARAVVLAASVVLLFLVYKIGRNLSSSTMWGMTAAVVASSEPFFTSRVADVRTDAFAAVALTGAILLLLRGDDLRSAASAGLLAGCGATLSTKLVLALPLIAIAAALRVQRRRAVTLIVTASCAGIAGLAYLGWRLLADGPPVIESILGDLRFAAAQQATSKTGFLLKIFSASPLLWIAVIGGALASLSIGRTRSMTGYIAFTASFLAILFTSDPFLYPYIMLIVTPLVAPFVAGFSRAITNDKWRAIAAAIICAAVTLSGLPAATRPIRETNEEQRRFIEWVLRATAPDETVFDWQGLHVGRQGPFHWYIFGGLVPRYRGGWYSAAEEWKRSRVTVVIDNYRLAWLTPRDGEFLRSHYVYIAPCLIVPGTIVRRSATPASIEIAVAGDYRILPPGEEILLDGRSSRGRVRLQTGTHTVAFARPGRSEIAIVFTTKRREAAGPPPCPAGPLLFGF